MTVSSLSTAEPYATSKELVDENAYPLNQLHDLLLLMPCTLYQQLFDTQSVGKHVRHVLEHYQTLLTGLKDSVQKILSIMNSVIARQRWKKIPSLRHRPLICFGLNYKRWPTSPSIYP